jgi:uncharacterized protein
MTHRAEPYTRLRQRIAEFPVIDCHDHSMGPGSAPAGNEPIARLTEWYVQHDMASVVFPGWPGARPDLIPMLQDPDRSTEEKWPYFEPIWRRMEHTAYARVTKLMLRDVCGERDMSLQALLRARDRLPDMRDPAVYKAALDRAHITCRLVNIWIDLKAYVAGQYQVYERDRFMIPLPEFHDVRSLEQVCKNTEIIDAHVTSLDEYVAVCREIFRRMRERGAAGMKDQSAYTRTLAFENPGRAEAEAAFNSFMSGARPVLGWPEAKVLDDYLFQRFMEMARDLDLPVQIHTGHMARVRDEISKTNAVLLTPLLNLHRDVRFDLFHGNWPYAGEYLFLGKNYPNVHLDLCWLHMIDPVYSQNLLSQGLTVVPHGKFHAFGADCGDDVAFSAAHLELALDVVAAALAERVEADWIDEAEALRIAADWLFNNPNEYFKLGFTCFQP